MAKIYPSNFDVNLISNDAEREVFLSLKQLSNDFVVLYSFNWVQSEINNSKPRGEADFVIIHPKKGILVLEVKRGNVYLLEGRWVYESGNSMSDPIEQANESMYRFIKAIKGSTGEKVNFVSGVWFPHLRNEFIPDRLPLNYTRTNILTKNDLENPEAAISRLFKLTNHSSFNLDKVVNVLLPSFNMVKSISNLINISNETILRLTNEQCRLLDYLDEQDRATIHGSAGTGKTLLAVNMAEKVANENNKVLLMCFNSYLKRDLEMKIDNINIDVQTIHSLAYKIISDNDVTEEDLIWILKDSTKNDFPYDSIIIDEGQDFPDEIIVLLDKLARKVFYVFYDKNQLIQKRVLPKWLETSDCRLILSKNCRNTVSISTTSSVPVNISFKENIRLIKGEKPFIYCSEDPDQIIEKVFNEVSRLVEEEKLNYHQVVVLTAKKEDTSILSNNDYMRELNEKGVLFTTARKFKGLESDVVFIVDLDTDFFKQEQAKRILYVASSRARNLLYLFFNENDKNSNEIAKLFDDVPNTRKGSYAIARVLKGNVIN